MVEDCVTQDAGISGASRHNRPALIAQMARIREWEILLCWDFARLARNEEDLGWIRNRLKATKKDAVAVSTGRSIHDLGSRVEGVIAAEYLEKLALDTHRGLRGRAEQGLAFGGTPYGYVTQPLQRDAHGAPVPKTGFRWVVHPSGSRSGPADLRPVHRRGRVEGNGQSLEPIGCSHAPGPRSQRQARDVVAQCVAGGALSTQHQPLR